MSDKLNIFLRKIEQKNSEINFNFGIAVYNKMFERQIKRYNSYSTFSFSVLKKSTFSYFDKHYSCEDAAKLKTYVENDLKNKEKTNKLIKYKKHIILAFITKFMMKKLYNKYHNDISYNYEGLQQYIYNNLYQEVIDITSPDGKMYFTNFKQLSKEIIELGFSNEDSLNIILEIVKLNIERYEKIKDNKLPFYYENLKKQKSETLSKRQFKKIIKQIENEEICTLIIEYNSIKDACDAIYENYITKPKDIKDIQCLHDSLLLLKIDENLCNKIAFSLNKKLKKIKNSSTAIKNDNYIPIKSKEIISKKEQITIIRELETYFDFNNMKSIRLLSLNEIIYCVHLLMKNSSNTETIDNFISLSIKRIRKEHPLFIYNDLYNKFNYYKEKYGIDNIITNINKELENLFICEDKEYIKIKATINEYVKFILNEIGNNYEYEIEEASKIKVLNKNT